MSFIRILTDVKSRNKIDFDFQFIQVITWSLMWLIRPESDYNLIISHIDAAKSKNKIEYDFFHILNFQPTLLNIVSIDFMIINEASQARKRSKCHFFAYWRRQIKKWNFEDENLENGKRFWCAVFCKCLGTMWTTFWPSLTEFLRVVSEKMPKNPSKFDIMVIYGWTGIFSENPAVSLLSHYRYLTSCEVSRKSLQPFSRNNR